MNNHLKDILVHLARAGVRFIVCGGVAVVLHGYERMTLDLDLSVDMERENVLKLLSELKKLNLVPRAPVAAEVLLDPAEVAEIVKTKHALVFTFVDLEKPFRQVDVFLTHDFSFPALAPFSEEIKLEGERVRVIAKSKLIEMKRAIQPPRDKDEMDIRGLSGVS
jgi:hypothetical protein